MDIKPSRVVNSGDAGYRKPRIKGTVDVWHGLQRYIFLQPHSARHLWRESVARYIYQQAPDKYAGTPDKPRGADLVRLESTKLGGQVAHAYRIGPLKTDGQQAKSRRTPGAAPVHTQGGLELRAIIQRGTPEWSGMSGAPRGCVLAFDGAAGPCYVYHKPANKPGDRLARAFQYSSGPRPAVKLVAPAVYMVDARPWTADEVADRARIRAEAVAADKRKRARLAVDSPTKIKAAARAEAVKLDRLARGFIAEIAHKVDVRADSLKRAMVRAVSLASPVARAEAVRAGEFHRAKLASLWCEYDAAVDVQGPALRGVRGPRVPACAPGGRMGGAGQLGGPDGRPVTYGM